MINFPEINKLICTNLNFYQLVVRSLIKNNQIRSRMQLLEDDNCIKTCYQLQKEPRLLFSGNLKFKKSQRTAIKTPALSAQHHILLHRFAAVPSLQAYSCFIMPRRIECVRCSKSLEYKGYKRHLLTCNGSGRFCPICCTDIALEGLALTEHLINCQRKTLVFVSSLKISIFYISNLYSFIDSNFKINQNQFIKYLGDETTNFSVLS